jgi:hypothetical protein
MILNVRSSCLSLCRHFLLLGNIHLLSFLLRPRPPADQKSGELTGEEKSARELRYICWFNLLLLFSSVLHADGRISPAPLNLINNLLLSIFFLDDCFTNDDLVDFPSRPTT